MTLEQFDVVVGPLVEFKMWDGIMIGKVMETTEEGVSIITKGFGVFCVPPEDIIRNVADYL